MVNDNTWSAQPLYGRDITQEMRNVNALQLETQVPIFNRKWGEHGGGEGQFFAPWSLKLDALSNVYLADSKNERIQKFNSIGVFQLQFGAVGVGDGQFSEGGPLDLALDSSGNIFVLDFFGNRIQKFSPEGAYQAQFGTFGADDGQFNGPSGITIDSSNNIYITDRGNIRVQKFDASLSFVLKWGSSGVGNGEFGNVIQHIIVDGSGNILVADQSNDRIQKFTSSGTYLSQFEASSCRHLAVDSLGFIWVTNQGANTFTKYSANGFPIVTAGGFELAQSDGKYFNLTGIAVHSNGDIYTADSAQTSAPSQTDRIQVFSSSLLVQTEFVKYTTGGTVSLGTPDGGVAVPALAALDSGAAIVAPDHIIDIRTAIEALAPFYINAITGNAFNWNGAQANSLYRIALGNRDTDPSDFGFSSPTPADDWQRTKVEMDNDPTYDIDIGEVALCIDKLQASALE